MAAALLSQLWGEFLFLLLEIVELHLHESMTIQFKIQSGEELRADAFLADFQRGLEALSLGLESADLGIRSEIMAEHHPVLTAWRKK